MAATSLPSAISDPPTPSELRCARLQNNLKSQRLTHSEQKSCHHTCSPPGSSSMARPPGPLSASERVRRSREPTVCLLFFTCKAPMSRLRQMFCRLKEAHHQRGAFSSPQTSLLLLVVSVHGPNLSLFPLSTAENYNLHHVSLANMDSTSTPCFQQQTPIWEGKWFGCCGNILAFRLFSLIGGV